MRNTKNTEGGSQTTAPITASAAIGQVLRSSQVLPEFVRLPRAGQCEVYSSLARSKLNELILPSEANGHKPPVKSVCLRQRGAKKGVRLISLDSLLSYLRGQMQEQNQEAA